MLHKDKTRSGMIWTAISSGLDSLRSGGRNRSLPSARSRKGLFPVTRHSAASGVSSYLKVPSTREVMCAEILIQGILSGRTVDMKETEENFSNPAMIETIRDYVFKTGSTAE